MKRIVLFVLALLLFAPILAGCADKGPELTVEEAKQWFSDNLELARKIYGFYTSCPVNTVSQHDDGTWITEDGRTYMPYEDAMYCDFPEFKSLADANKLAESVYTKEYLEKNLYNCYESNAGTIYYPLYKEFNGKLYANVDGLSGYAFQGPEWVVDTLEIIEQTKDSAVIQMETMSFNSTPESWGKKTLLLERVDGEWKFNDDIYKG